MDTALTTLIKEIKSNNELWDMFENIKSINNDLKNYHTLDISIMSQLDNIHDFLIKPKTKVYCTIPITKNINKVKTELFFAISDNTFELIENEPKNIIYFNKGGWATRSARYPSLVVKRRAINLSQYDGLFNAIFDNHQIYEFVLSNMNDDGKQAYSALYEEYKKHSFDKDIFIRKSIFLDKGGNDPTIFGAGHPKNNLNIYTTDFGLSFKYNDYVNGKYENKSIQIIREFDTLSNTRIIPAANGVGGEPLEKIKSEIIEKYFFDIYLMHLNSGRINKALTEMRQEYTENSKEYISFLEKAKEIIAKYYILTKI
jgi:hypothetical protein